MTGAANNEPREWSIRVTVLTDPNISRRRAEEIAVSVARFAEKRAGVHHVYERDVYDLDLEEENGAEN